MKLKIKTPVGNYYYKYVPIFLGIKPIDKVIAKENLLLLKKILNNNDVSFILAFGTLLGAVREHDFISHDEDIDLIMFKKDMPKFLSLLFILRENGFDVVRYEPRGFLSIMRKGEYIDFYFFDDYPKNKTLCYCCRDMYSKKRFEDTTEIEFLGDKFQVPRDYEKYLEFYYGSNWMIPIPYINYKMTAIKKAKLLFIQYVKFLLPVCVTEKIQKRSDKPFLEKWLKKIQQLGLY
ncbi:MAG: LicD family protein [Prevotella sp.]|nr:LicD family protein [Prevotella sp.]